MNSGLKILQRILSSYLGSNIFRELRIEWEDIKMKLTGAQILIECLKEQNVDTIFGFPGGAVLNIYDALYKAKDDIKHILTSH